jgi:outer membrane protein, heavy metal efflux system
MDAPHLRLCAAQRTMLVHCRAGNGRRCLPGIVLLLLATTASAGLSLDEATQLALEQAPALTAQQDAVAAAEAGLPAAAALPDPRLSVGIDNLPISGAGRFSLTNEAMTMRRVGLMQDVPNRAKRDARTAGAQARVERERAALAVAHLAVRRETSLAWLAVYFAEASAARLADLDRENQVLVDTLDARIAAGKAMPAESTVARLEALALADRHDDLQRDIAKARAALRRWVGARADDTLEGGPPALPILAGEVRAGLHRHAEIAPYEAMQAMAQAEASEIDADQRGDWGWELAYSRRASQYGDMVSFQFKFDLPWQRDTRQGPQLAAKRKEVERIAAERDETLRKHAEETEAQLAELQALDAQWTRLDGVGQQLAAERVALALASYRAGRGDLDSVLNARRQAIETGLRLIELDAQRTALRVRLTTLIAE